MNSQPRLCSLCLFSSPDSITCFYRVISLLHFLHVFFDIFFSRSLLFASIYLDYLSVLFAAFQHFAQLQRGCFFVVSCCPMVSCCPIFDLLIVLLASVVIVETVPNVLPFSAVGTTSSLSLDFIPTIIAILSMNDVLSV